MGSDKGNDQVMRELGHDSGRTPRWMIPVIGLLLIGGAFAVSYYMHPDRAGEVDLPDKLARSIEIKRNLPSDLKELQRLVVGKDTEVAKAAAVKLAISSDEGWNLLLDRLAQAAPEVHSEIQDFIFAENMYVCTTLALESDKKNLRDGAIIALDRPLHVKTPRWGPAYVFDSLVHVMETDPARTEKMLDMMATYHPKELDPFFAAIKDEPAGVREAAVRAIWAESCVKSVTEARAFDKKVDPKLGPQVEQAIKRCLANMKSDG